MIKHDLDSLWNNFEGTIVPVTWIAWFKKANLHELCGMQSKFPHHVDKKNSEALWINSNTKRLDIPHFLQVYIVVILVVALRETFLLLSELEETYLYGQ